MSKSFISKDKYLKNLSNIKKEPNDFVHDAIDLDKSCGIKIEVTGYIEDDVKFDNNCKIKIEELDIKTECLFEDVKDPLENLKEIAKGKVMGFEHLLIGSQWQNSNLESNDQGKP